MMTYRSETTLDAVDWRIVRELQQDGRASFSELGRRIGLSQPAVAERVRRLEAAGVICGYRAEVALELLGLPIVAFIRLSVSSDQCARFAEFIRTVPAALQAHRITGDESYLVQVAAVSVRHLEAIIDLLSPFGQPRTSLVLSTALASRAIDEGVLPQPGPKAAGADKGTT